MSCSKCDKKAYVKYKDKNDYEKNPSDISGSFVNIHENSPFLDTIDGEEPQYSGSRWIHAIKTKI